MYLRVVFLGQVWNRVGKLPTYVWSRVFFQGFGHTSHACRFSKSIPSLGSIGAVVINYIRLFSLVSRNSLSSIVRMSSKGASSYFQESVILDDSFTPRTYSQTFIWDEKEKHDLLLLPRFFWQYLNPFIKIIQGTLSLFTPLLFSFFAWRHQHRIF